MYREIAVTRVKSRTLQGGVNSSLQHPQPCLGLTQSGQMPLILSKPWLIIQHAGLLSSPLTDGKHNVLTCSLYCRRLQGVLSPRAL